MYIKLPKVTGGGGGGTSDDITNNSNIPGTTVTDALNTEETILNNIINIQSTTQYKNDTITLSATDITNKYVILTDAPVTKDATQLFITSSGSPWTYGIDFIITSDDGGKRASWSGYNLQTILAENDTLLFLYN
jgi:hypothetical protein